MICLEMIGYYTAKQPSAGLLMDLLYPRAGDFVIVAGRFQDALLARAVKAGFRGAGGIDVFSLTMNPGIGGSDHINYWDRGMGAVLVTDTAYMRNPHYHTSGDKAATLDYQRLAAVTSGVANSAIHMTR